MKPVSDGFKEQIKEYGRQIDTTIKYTDKDGEHLLDSDVLYSVTPSVNGNILKSVMKQLDFESSVRVEKGTIINTQFGVKVNEDYEYINLGDYIVSKEPEYNADTQTYSHICYDKMLYSMKEYQRLDIKYPITIRSYINTLCQTLGITFKNVADTFANYDKEIKLDLYGGLGYTYRDILDELAEVTASTICINETTGQLEIRYLNDTQEVINEDYLKDINVEFGEKYGPINSIVLSRAAESDNVFLQNETSIQLNGLCELKIIDNQIMNDNDRSIFLTDILEKMDGTTYYINDFSSRGITWLELCDKYIVQIGEKQYPCVLFNDEIKITQGLEETIYTELPSISETDYTKADETDKKINQTYLMVDKQNQKIESVINNVTDQNNKIAQVTQTVDELNSKIGDIADITTSQETLNGTISFEGINQSEPIYVRIYPTGVNISYLYPRENLYPSETLFMTVRTLRFINTTTNEYVDYELPTDLLYYDAENYDEFILDYDAQTCVVNKRVGYNADGTTYLLENPQTIEYEYPKIELTDGDYTVTLLGYTNAYMLVRLMAQNIYTTQFATKAEVNAQIKETTQSIDLSVDKKLTSYPTTTQMNAAISVKANEITTAVASTYETKEGTDKKIEEAKGEIKVTTDAINAEVEKKVDGETITGAYLILKINGDTSEAKLNADKIELSATDVLNLLAGNEINLSSNNITMKATNLTIDKDGNIDCSNINIKSGTIKLSDGTHDYPSLQVGDFGTSIYKTGLMIGKFYADVGEGNIIQLDVYEDEPAKMYLMSSLGETAIYLYGANNGTVLSSDGITTPTVTQTSLAEQKKNFEKLQDNAIDIIKNIDIYKYNLKGENDTDKKHIGFVIGKDYNYSKEVTSLDNKGVDNYSFTSLCCKAIQEQQELIEQLQKEIKQLKGEN